MQNFDYSAIRGFCYPAAVKFPLDKVRKELGWAQKLRLNSARIWLSYKDYRDDPEKFRGSLAAYVQTANTFGISTMPILFNGNGIDISILETDFYEFGDSYVRAVVDTLKNEEGLFVWDIMNEPSCNDYIRKSPEGEIKDRYEKMWTFVRHYCNLTKELDPNHPITVGHTFPRDIEPTVNEVDVISFHDYLETKKRIQASYDLALSIGEKYGKQVINSEMACLCRANPYDLALEMCEKNHVGWYIFELMIQGYWSGAHGVFYPDGSIRDPSIVASIMGFHRNKSVSAIRANPNMEGNVQRAIREVKSALEEKTELFHFGSSSQEGIFEAAEYCANLLECGEMVPMWDPPTAKIERLRSQKNPDLHEVRRLAFDLAKLLEECCCQL
jgi:hypothetical protein